MENEMRAFFVLMIKSRRHREIPSLCAMLIVAETAKWRMLSTRLVVRWSPLSCGIFLIHLVFPLALIVCANHGFQSFKWARVTNFFYQSQHLLLTTHEFSTEHVWIILPHGQQPTQAVVSSGWVHCKPKQIFPYYIKLAVWAFLYNFYSRFS